MSGTAITPRDEELGTLCRTCGMCCDGTLFEYGGLQPGEVSRARKIGLRVIDRGTAFEQPCAAFDAGGVGCTVYEDRPEACRAFRCRLFERHRVEGGPLAPRLADVAEARALLARYEAGPADEALLEEIRDRLERDFARAGRAGSS